MKLCKDCKHFDETEYGSAVSPQCRKASGIEPVRGLTYYMHCDTVRRDSYKCGIAGDWFEPKDAATP